MAETDRLALVADIASSYLRRNSVAPEQIATVIATVSTALQRAGRELEGGSVSEGAESVPTSAKAAPAVTVRSSVKPETITCLDCGARQKTLKRHLQSSHKLTPDQYREKWNLKSDYPMVAPNYSAKRSQMAKQIGLGQKTGGRRRRKQG
jgi:predicted transcriptional regulator